MKSTICTRPSGSPTALRVMMALLMIAVMGDVPAALAKAPIAYPSAGQSLEQQSKDEAECRIWSTQQTGVYPDQAPPEYYGNSYAPTGNVVRGAARGAALGAVGGAIGGNAGKGAKIGAGVGATAGLLRNGRQRRDHARANDQAAAQYQADLGAYSNAFAACMQGRGYAVR
jgi:hypothetical protein